MPYGWQQTIYTNQADTRQPQGLPEIVEGTKFQRSGDAAYHVQTILWLYYKKVKAGFVLDVVVA